ncbi:uncharacterized protein J4E79_006504 [Alternaria viburni]|uniref:uncharacterized protein n=1 Tax=Alternaria viburni TaxID=566460 RepID=UPI0020C3BBA3|nr:uncharacterized protein J4E79_006504 [Alternaria viburni]KAI4658745.1 hypothetical protein J4E79_006504 [Alternaria viburni]
MVLYHANGRVVEKHDQYLDDEARSLADHYRYIDQVDVYNQKSADASSDNVEIIIDKQEYRTLYCEREGYWETIKKFRRKSSYTIPTTVDRATLRKCSTFADDHFTYNPGAKTLHLPVRYPRQHHAALGELSTQDFDINYHFCVSGKRLAEQPDDQMAFIRPEEINEYVIPWLQKMQKQINRKGDELDKEDDARSPKETRRARQPTGPDGAVAMGIPVALDDKIHLYNAMLQLGLPKSVQLPLIDKIVMQMYKTKLNACHLATLEHTVGRFYSRGVAVLDPVLCHFIGTYPRRTLQDRRNVKPPPESDTESSDDTNKTGEEASEEAQGADTQSGEELSASAPAPKPFDFKNSERKYLSYYPQPAGRAKPYDEDTYLLPPELPVIGHSIKHWSGVRKKGSTAAAHNGFPLNIGKYKKFIRRNATDVIDVNDYFEEETNRLAHQKDYEDNGPGEGN